MGKFYSKSTVLFQRWLFSPAITFWCNGLPSLTLRFASTCSSFRIPGMTVDTAGCMRIWRNASSGIVMPSGTDARMRSTRSSVSPSLSGAKYTLRKSPSGQRAPGTNVPVRLPSSKGTLAMTAICFSRHAGKSSSSGL